MKYLLLVLLASSIKIIVCKTLIVTNDEKCSKLTKNVFLNGGNIIDAGITAVICEGIVNPQDTGIGGGFTGVVKLRKKTFMINAREKTPYLLKSVDDIKTKKYGAIGVPGMIKGTA